MVNVPGGVYLAPEHTWVKVELAGDARIGLDDFFHKLVGPLADEMGDAYPELRRDKLRITEVLKAEEERFF